MAKMLKITHSSDGWGGPLEVEVVPGKKVICVTGTGIHPVAKAIAEAAGVPVCDAFKDPIPDEEVLVAVINCGGTLRCGLYPKKNIPTVNLNAIGPSGPFAQYIHEDNYVSGVTVEDIQVVDGTAPVAKPAAAAAAEPETPAPAAPAQPEEKENFGMKFVQVVGSSVGKFTALFYESAKESVDLCLHTVIPFMAFVSVICTIILMSGLGDIIGNILKPMAGNIVGLVILSLILSFPFISPIVGAGAAVAQIMSVLIGTEIAKGTIAPNMALPALFAINYQCGADSLPVGLAMEEAKPDTVKYGMPANYISRFITAPFFTIAAYLCSFGMF